MIQTIYKIQLEITGEQIIGLPKGARILSIQPQGEKVSLWFLFNQDETRSEPKKIRCFGTGQPIIDAENLDYIGTVQVLCGKLVFHFFIDITYTGE